jgi:2-keto-myo-inositol isomerase
VNPVARNVTLSLNRIAKPQLPMAEFLELTASLGMQHAEVRNDLPGVGVLDGLPQAELQAILARTGVRIATINALYPFESVRHLEANLEKLRGLVAEARKVGCKAIVMCPFNEKGDPRTPRQRAEELVTALDAYGPLYAEAGMTGLIEPLGFERSALRTKRAALEGIDRCKHPGAFALLHDTFHHYLSGEEELFPARTGFVHVSGVAGKPPSAIQDDDDRILVDETDVMDNRGQVAKLLDGDCKAVVSFEPFGPAVRAMPVPALKEAILRSVKYLLA